MGSLRSKGKVAVIGSGFVGASAAFAMAMSGNISEMVIIDVNKEKAIGEAMDINHGLPFMGQMTITAGDYEDVSGADVIVITAGTARKPGETRLDLTRRNAGIIKDIVPNIMKHYTGSVIVVVSNPVDVLTYLVQKLSGLPANKIVGSGTVLDSARFRYLISEHCGIDVKNVHAYIMGEHGDSQFPVWSATHIAGKKLDELCNACPKKCNNLEKERIVAEVKDSGAKIIKYKGATYYGIALSINRILEAILKNQNSVLTVGSVIHNRYGVNDVVLSLPCVVNAEGIEKVFDIDLTEDEQLKLQESARKIREMIDQVM